jgi:hypothetical protein
MDYGSEDTLFSLSCPLDEFGNCPLLIIGVDEGIIYGCAEK